MTEFYGEKKAKYIFIPVPIFMNGGWGLRIQTVEGEISHYIGGPHGLQGRFPVFNKDRLRYLVFHEFGHSFVNPLVHEHMNQINKYKHLFSYMKEDMAKLTYPNWEVTVFEHIVRAGETLLLEIAGFKDQSQRAYQRSINSGFVMLPQFRDKMVLYQKNREKYPTFRSFFPELLEVLQDDYNFSHKKRP
jgi:predicted DNA-binding protein YlxM (UPF0122 family)